MKEIIVGTRASELALVQTNLVVDSLVESNPDYDFRVKKISTKGDRILNKPLPEIGGKGIFIKELELALLNEEIDLAVHSFKDLPAELLPGLTVGAIPARETALDVLISEGNLGLEQLPAGARIGTGSLRRRAQLLNYRPDLEIVGLRGNIDTRLKKLATASLDGIVLAAAGLERMGWQDKISQYLSPGVCLPAARQGALAVEIRTADQRMKNLLAGLNHLPTVYCVTAEQSFLSYFNGGCKVPLGAYAIIEKGEILLTGMVASIDGSSLLRDKIRGASEDAVELGIELAKTLEQQGAGEILKELQS